MKKEDEFIYKTAILTISNKCWQNKKEDKAGTIIRKMIQEGQGKIVQYEVIPDDVEMIKEKLIHYCDDLKVELILTNGGTGLTPTDFTPEATKEIIEREIPGIPEAMRIESLKITKKAMISRGVAGIRKRTLIINLPGSSRGARQSLQVIYPDIPFLLKAVSGERST